MASKQIDQELLSKALAHVEEARRLLRKAKTPKKSGAFTAEMARPNRRKPVVEKW